MRERDKCDGPRFPPAIPALVHTYRTRNAGACPGSFALAGSLPSNCFSWGMPRPSFTLRWGAPLHSYLLLLECHRQTIISCSSPLLRDHGLLWGQAREGDAPDPAAPSRRQRRAAVLTAKKLEQQLGGDSSSEEEGFGVVTCHGVIDGQDLVEGSSSETDASIDEATVQQALLDMCPPASGSSSKEEEEEEEEEEDL